MSPPRLLISAAHKSSGKTTLSIGIGAALTRAGVAVRPFKKGPDFIDPLWLGLATDHPCHNLDFHTQSPEEILGTLGRYGAGGDLCLIEGNKGLHDGMDLAGSNSNAALAKLVRAPVVLVVDTQGITRGIAPLLLGYQAFDPEVTIAGVILNKVGGQRHEGKLRQIVEHYTDLPILGAVHRRAELQIDERHLGLIPSNEQGSAADTVDRIARVVAEQVALDRLLALAQAAPDLSFPAASPASAPAHTRDVRIGIPRDAAFGFYYPGDLEALMAAGAELVFFDALHDAGLPAIDGLFIGGGFPETQMEGLAANASLMRAIRSAIEGGLPAYAECGGLMYLARSIRWGTRQAPMVGVVPGDVVMHDRPIGRGYVHLHERQDRPWPISRVPGATIHAHEFHHSSLEGLPPGTRFAFEVVRGHGIDGHRDGIVYKNLLAGYAHLRHVEASPWAEGFVAFVRRCRAASNRAVP